MKLSLRFLIPLTITMLVIAYLLTPLVVSFTEAWFVKDVEIRGKLVASTIENQIQEMDVSTKSSPKVLSLLNRATQDERLFAIGICNNSNKFVVKTSSFPDNMDCKMLAGLPFQILEYHSWPLHIASFPITDGDKNLVSLILLHDLSFIKKRSQTTQRYLFILFAVVGIIISILTVFIAQLSWRGWVSGIQSFVKGEGIFKPLSAGKNMSPEIQPVLKDLRALVKDLEQNRRVRDISQISWSPKALKEILHKELKGDEILIVSNREPYIHVKNNDQIETLVPASGLVTALEPIMRACSGTWIAHGSGNADKLVVDKHDRIKVPPENPSYQIRRVWLSKEEEEGYYYGFANEGLWPLCHIAHVRPIFRSSNWEYYKKVNQKFADAVVQEAKTSDPVILVQDYHFALLPKMIKEKLPNATIITFWHIPWPNPESFGICPWREEILQGFLGSTIIGFHTRFHCNNFIDSVDRFLESRIDREMSAISLQGSWTIINQYPISIEYPVRWSKNAKGLSEIEHELRKNHDIAKDVQVGIGVDRMDYTKGILERFLAIERMLELYSATVGKFTFIQIAAPTRSSIEQYQHFANEVQNLANKINHRFATDNYQPIILKAEHHSPAQIYDYYRMADICMVTSLHDGMNLVAKEFIAAKDDESGVLILSQFAGAARELPEAIIVNPYNIDQCAEAIKNSLEMPINEQKERMKSMRGYIQEYNVYRWAGKMLMDAARIRLRNKVVGTANFSNI